MHDDNQTPSPEVQAAFNRKFGPDPVTALRRAMTELARLELAAATAATAANPEVWDGTPLEALDEDNRIAMFMRASDRLGFGRRWPIAGLEDRPGSNPIPPARPGMVVYLEGREDEPQVVAEVLDGGARVVFEDGSFLDPWPDLVDDVGQPWPPFTGSPPIAWCPDCGEQTSSDEDRCCLTCGRDLIILADRHSAEILAQVLPDAAVEALDKIAALSGCSEWDYPGQVVRDVKGIKGRAALDLAQELEARARYDLTMATGRAPEVNREIAAELLVVAQRLYRDAGQVVELGELQRQIDLELPPEPRPPGRYRDTDGMIGTLGDFDPLARRRVFTPDGAKIPAVLGPGFEDPRRYLSVADAQRLEPVES